MMNAQRFRDVAGSPRSVLLASSAVVLLTLYGATRLEITVPAPLELAAAAIPPRIEPAAVTPLAGIARPSVDDVAMAVETVAAAAAETPPAIESREPAAAAREPVVTIASPSPAEVAPAPPVVEPREVVAAPSEPVVKLASADPTEILPTETPQQQTAAADAPSAASAKDDAKDAPKDIVGSVEVLDECLVVDACIDRYLWALYQRTPKEDTIKEPEQRKVAVKRKGKMVTVTRTFTKLVDEDFAWKDPKAADKAGMSLRDYVIGGMDKGFKLKLFHTLLAAEAAGLSPGITSAFRDDYRQSIASGLKAASNRSYHGGSLRGGYGHGLAADIVSVKGATRDQRWASSEKLWKWVDANAKALGIARPYLDHDPPHVAPADGQEYASHRGGASVRHVAAKAKGVKTKKVAAHSAPKRQKAAQKLAKQSKVRAG